MAEIRKQLELQLDVFKSLYELEAQQDFQTEVLDVIGEVDPNARAEILRRLAHRRLYDSLLTQAGRETVGSGHFPLYVLSKR